MFVLFFEPSGYAPWEQIQQLGLLEVMIWNIRLFALDQTRVSGSTSTALWLRISFTFLQMGTST